MSYTLYYLPGTCSMAVHVLLNELSQPVKLENVSVPDGQPRPAEYLKLNPRGSVPTLMDGDIVIREGGAIMTYLMDKHKMLPADAKGRAHALEWLMFANATMHPAYARMFWLMKTKMDEAAKKQLMDTQMQTIQKFWADVDGELAKNPFLGGKEPTAADFLFAVIANWGRTSFAKEMELPANVQRMVKAVSARPSFKKALEAEQVDYKAAA